MLPGTTDAGGLPAPAARAEELGFAFLGAGEHVLFGSPTSNAFVTLAAAAATTTRIRLLSAVTLLPLYPPALAAKMAATLDRVSGGRFELGVGVGGENPAEFAACGVPVSGRGRRTDAALDVVRAYLAGDAVPVEGEPTRLDPLPVGPVPIWIGGRTEASMRRAGRAGDVWMPYLCSPDRVTRGLRVANDVAAEQGRGPVTGGLLAWSAVAASRAEARTLAVGTLRRIYGQDMERIVDRCVPHGTADDVVARFAEYADAGAEQILYAPLCDEGGYAAAVEEVGRALGASGGHSGWMTEDPPDSKVRDPEEF
jgi:alkanesulfonate monooxygenase SsuD/methylene tetrahydromethanopterin reductase-like flavin-dependent oxidoreductase (luciferase family)